MPILMRAAQAALVASVLAVSAPGAHAQPSRPQPGAQPMPTLQPMRAQPPARRRPPPQTAPAPQRPPAAQPASTRPRVAPTSVAGSAQAGQAGPPSERWEDISVQTANSGVYKLPAGRGHSGPSVLHVQVLLNRAFFSAGMLDGRWGRNTQNAVLWLQAREGLPSTGAVDSVTYARLAQLAGAGPTIREHVLTADDVRGPFIDIPADIYAHARLRCSCYESLSEKLTENFQSTRELLRRLNPGVNLDSVAAGTALFVPQVRDTAAAPGGLVRQIVVSGVGNYLQALDADGRILYHFAATLGSTVDPSPNGNFRVTSIHPDPWWNYQPRLLAHVPDDRPNALIPPGPNNAVGRVWMALSAPHYGIHGTKSPETIGYAESAGCVRLTNWDVTFLSGRVPPGTPVSFRDIRGREQEARPAAQPAPQRPAQQPAVLGVSADSTRRDTAAARPDSARRTLPAADTARPATAPARPATTQPANTRPAADTTRPATTPARPAPTQQPAPAQPKPATPAPAPADSAKAPPRS
jgi:lipoprotein-anchoring transpeptidase ErfK/SrfK